jgi:hypothetical protein
MEALARSVLGSSVGIVGILWVASHGQVVGAAPSARQLVDRAAAYVRWYDQQLPAIVGSELYQQRAEQHKSARLLHREERTLHSTVAWVHLPLRVDTIAVREVVQVNETGVHASFQLRRLLEGPTEQLEADVRKLLDESAAHNLAAGSRNINFPTFPLVYLRSPYVDRGRWRIGGREGTSVLLDFEERGRPTAVRSPMGDSLRGKGRFWVDEKSGRIHRIEIRVAGRRITGQGSRQTSVAEVSYQANITFSAETHLGLWLPAAMIDIYDQFGGVHRLKVDGQASYSNYRRFETSGRVLPNVR